MKLSLLAILAGLFLIAECLAGTASPVPLGRLFFTPEQRAELDRRRQEGANSGPVFNGEIRRSSDRNTRWINGNVTTGNSDKRPPLGSNR